MNEFLVRMLSTSDQTRAPLLVVRGMVSFIFLLEGALKFISPEKLGVGRFVKIGIPWPEVMAPFVGAVEITGGFLILLGLLTRLAAIALVIDMLVAIASTKIPILMHSGIWDMAHEARLDFAMLACSCLLFAVGAGALSVDDRLLRPRGRIPAATRSERASAVY